MDGKKIADDIHSTVRHEIVMGIGASFEPHRPGNPLDVFLKNFDTHGKDMFRASIDTAIAAEREACCKVIRDSCPACGGTGMQAQGVIHFVTKEMAIDAGCLDLEGMPVRHDPVECEFCGRPISAIRTRTP